MRSAVAVILAGLCLVSGTSAFATEKGGDERALMLPCHFPEGKSLHLSLEQHFFSSQGKPVVVTVLRKLQFGRDTAGSYLEAWPAHVETSASGPQAARLEALYGWAGTAPMRLWLDSYGAVIGIAQEERYWAAFLARQRMLLPQNDAGHGRDSPAERARLAYQALAGASPAQRRSMLGGFIEPLVRHCGQLVNGKPSPDERTIGFSDEKPANEAGVAERIGYWIDAQTGLATLIERVATPVADPLRPLRETWRLTADN